MIEFCHIFSLETLAGTMIKESKAAKTMTKLHFGHQQVQGGRAARPRFDQGGRDRSTAVSIL
jgi:hypothetical protein